MVQGTSLVGTEHNRPPCIVRLGCLRTLVEALLQLRYFRFLHLNCITSRNFLHTYLSLKLPIDVTIITCKYKQGFRERNIDFFIYRYTYITYDLDTWDCVLKYVPFSPLDIDNVKIK
jgi:hypothetical protein